MVRVEFAHVTSQKSRSLAVLSPDVCPSLDKIIATAKNKLKLKKLPLFVSVDGVPVSSAEAFFAAAKDGSLVLVSNDPFPAHSDEPAPSNQLSSSPRILYHHLPPIDVSSSAKNTVIHLVFSSAALLQAALKRPHIFYEKAELKGPLKGVNFPTDSLSKWVELVASEALLVSQTAQLNVSTSDPSNGDTMAAAPDPQTLFSTAELEILDLCFGHGWAVDQSSGKLHQSRPLTSTLSPFPQYLIAHLNGDKSTFVHEWAHAVFYLQPSYQTACAAVFNDASQVSDSFKTHVTKELILWNYSPSVILDEFQAYLVEGPATVFGKRWAVESKALQTLLRSHLGPIPAFDAK
ncbi:hypothetical protein HDU81_009989 [Chytriomyces hyalinus]|nr:hypothetical protein HDU81_009989 [Chytriomyces hyalinus]